MPDMKGIGRIKRLPWLLFFLVLILSFLLGSRMILSGDFYFLYDQARDLLLVKNIAVEHDLTLIGSRSGIGGFFHGPLYLYLLLPVFYLGGGNPFSFTAVNIAIGLLTVLAGFFVGKKLYNEWIGVSVAFFLAISPRIWSYFSVTQASALMPLTYLGLLYSLITYLRGKRIMFLWAAFLTGLTFQFETATSIILVPIVALTYFLLAGAIKQWKIILGSIGVFILSMTNFILFDLRHQFLMSKSIFTYARYGESGEGHMPLVQRIVSHSNGLWETFQAVLIENTLLLQILFLLIITFALIKLFTSKFKKQFRKEFFLFGLFPVVTFIFLLLYPRYVQGEYVLGLTVPVAFFISFCLSIIWTDKTGKLLTVIFFLVLLVQSFTMLSRQYSVSYQNNTPGSYRNQKAVTDWIFADAKGGKFGYFVYTPEVFTVGMDYLMWWEGKINNNPVSDNKQEITYLVMYPPLEGDKGAHDFWKKSVVRTNGEIISRKMFSGGIIVEKLKIPTDDPAPDPNYYQNLIFR